MNKRIIGLGLTATAIVGLAGTSFSGAYASSMKEYEGTIENAIAFGGKHNLMKGNPNSKDEDSESGIYYDMELLDDKDFGTSMGEKYGNKYVIFNEGLFDLSKGELLEDTAADLKYDALKDLRKALKGVSRYDVQEVSDIKNHKQELVNRFGDVWYSSEVELDKQDAGTGYIYYNATQKKWVDMSYKTKIYFYDKEAKKTIKVDEFDKTTNGYKFRVNNIKLLAQGDKSLFFLYNVDASKENGNTENLTYVVKASKSITGNTSVKTPSEIDAYLISSNSFSDSKLEKVTNVINNAKDFTVYKDKLYAITTGEDLTVTEIELGKDEIKLADEETKVNMRIAKIGSSDSVNSSEYSIDSNGKVWIINKKNVLAFNGDRFKEIDKVDGAINKLDVYDDNNAVFWSTTSELVVTKTGGSSSSSKYDEDDNDDDDDDYEDDEDTSNDKNNKDDDDESDLGIVGGDKNNDPISYNGHWEFGTQNPKWIKVDGTIGSNEWVYTNGAWYYVDENGYAVNGWKLIDGYWYYMDGTGKMQTGWIKERGKWYFLNANGTMATGWKLDGGQWYYLNPNDGVMITGWINYNGDWYFTGSNGVMKTGWYKDHDKWYYFNYQGTMLKDCVVDGYYLGIDGSMQEISERLNKQLNEVRAQEQSETTTTSTDSFDNYGSTGLYNDNNRISSTNNSDGSITFGATSANGF